MTVYRSDGICFKRVSRFRFNLIFTILIKFLLGKKVISAKIEFKMEIVKTNGDVYRHLKRCKCVIGDHVKPDRKPIYSAER